MFLQVDLFCLYFQKSQLKDIFLSINLDTTPEFLIEIILTYMSTNYEHIEHEVRTCIIYIAMHILVVFH